MTLVVVDSGVANLASIQRALRRLEAPSVTTRDPAVIRRASRLILPGVGSFAVAAGALHSTGAAAAVREHLGRGTPLLAVCLGMQLLCESSDESPGTQGLGVVSGICRRLAGAVRVPQLGWNHVHVDRDARLLASGEAAFAHSYALVSAPSGWRAAWTTHGERFVAAIERDRVLACQFHPELSGRWGLDLIRRWLTDEPAASSVSVPRREGLAHRLVACLDVRDGRVVKGVRFGGLRDAGDPAERAARYEEQGADEIALLDVGATPERRDHQVETVERVRDALGIPLTAGGGVRTLDDARALLRAGADKVTVNTAAARRPRLVSEMAGALGSQCTVLAVDARRTESGWEALLSGGREPSGRDALAWIREGVACGAGEVLLTSWDRDGTRAGCDLELLRAASRAVAVPIVASGGIGGPDDVARAARAGAEAVLCASILHDGDHDIPALKAALSSAGFAVRP